MRFARSSRLLALVPLCATFAACVLDQLFSPDLPSDLTVEITIDSLLSVGDTVPIEVRVLSGGAVVEGVRLSFESTRPSVATITADGQVAVLARDTFSIAAEVRSGSLAGDPPSATAALRGIAHRVSASLDTVLFSSLTATRQLSAACLTMQSDTIPDAPVTWRSESSGVVSVDSGGALQAEANGGPVLVIAEADGRADTVRVVVRQRTASMVVSPSDVVLRPAGDTVRFSAELRDSLDQPNSASGVSWSSTAGTVVTVDGNGLATAGAEGIAQIVALSDGVADTARVLVVMPLATLDVSIDSDTLHAIDATTHVSATGTDSAGNHVAAPIMSWRSLHEAVAVVDTAGVVTATGNGDAGIVGESGGVEDTVTVTVSQVIAGVVITSPGADTTFTSLGDSANFTAVAVDANSYAIPGIAFTWSAADTTIATVDANGTVVSKSVGTTRIDAEVDGHIGSVNVVVAQWLHAIAVSPDSVSLMVGETGQLVGTGHDARGYEIPGVAFSWASRGTGVVTVDGIGGITAVSDGAAYVVATSDGLSDSTFVRVGDLASVCGGSAHENDIVADETWTLVGSPHCVGGTVSVIGGSKLTIEAGVAVRFTPGSMLQLGRADLQETGSLFAEGTPGAPITFTPYNNTYAQGQWQGLQLGWVGVDDSLVLRNATIEYGGQSTNTGAISNLSTFSGTVVLDRVTIHMSSVDGIRISNLATATSSLIVDNSVIEDNEGSGILFSSGTVRITDTQIIDNNNAGVAMGPATEVTITRSQFGGNGFYGAELTGNNITVVGSRFWNNGFGGLRVVSNLPVIRGDTIESNSRHGLDVWQASMPTVEDNLIVDNDSAGAIINSALSVSGNRIRGNHYPLRVSTETLAALTGQDIDSLLGNDGDTLFISGHYGDISATDTVRTRSGLPWVVNGDVRFIGPSTWKIEPGATIILTTESEVLMNGGKVIADGADQGILFTGRNDIAGAWGGLKFLQPANDSSLLRNVTIRNGGSAYSPSLSVASNLTHAVILDSVMVVRSQGHGILISGPTVVRRFLSADSCAGSGLYATWAGLSVPAGRFNGNGDWGVRISGLDFTLAEAEIANNGIGGWSGGVLVQSQRSSITNSWIHDNSGQGISVSGVYLITHTFTANTVENNGSYGVQIVGSDVTFTDNIVRNNGSDGVWGDAGTYQVFAAFSGNTITGNSGYPVVFGPQSLEPFASQNQSDLLGNERDTLRIYSGWHSTDQANITGDIAVESFLPWQTDRSLTVGAGATLTLNAGATIVMDGPNAGLRIGESGGYTGPGRLIALGTDANPVTFTAADPASPWEVLAIVNQLDSSILRHTVIEYGGSAFWDGALEINDAAGYSVVLDTVTVQFADNTNGVAISTAAWVNGLSALDNDLSGLLLRGGTHTINGSRFERNGNAGIQIDGGTDHTIPQSILVDNIDWGLLNNTGVLVTAINNWWGDASGPSGSGPGTGDAVSSNVSFDPWLATPPSVP